MNAGDLIVGDADGVVAVPLARAAEVVQLATAREAKEAVIIERIRAGERTLEMAVRKMGLSARAHDRLLKLARTIADLGESDSVSAKHVAEAVQYRSLDRNYWT